MSDKEATLFFTCVAFACALHQFVKIVIAFRALRKCPRLSEIAGDLINYAIIFLIAYVFVVATRFG